MFLLCLTPPQPPYKGIHKGGAAEGRLLYMVTGEVASIAKTYSHISKCALNMYIDVHISHIPLESLSSQLSYTQVQACMQTPTQIRHQSSDPTSLDTICRSRRCALQPLKCAGQLTLQEVAPANRATPEQ